MHLHSTFHANTFDASIVSFLENAVAQLDLQRLRNADLYTGRSSSPRDLHRPTAEDGSQIPQLLDHSEEIRALAAAIAQGCSPLASCAANRRGILPHASVLFTGAELPFPLAFGTQRHVRWPAADETPVSARLPQEVAAKLIRCYVDHILPSFPLFTRGEIQSLFRRFDTTSDSLDEMEAGDRFTVCMILATAVLSSRSQDYHKLLSLAEALRRDAFRHMHLDTFVAESTCGTIQKLLLIAYYGFLLPSSANLWQVVGEAMRIALELGLHQDAPEGSAIDKSTVEYRIRLFWVVRGFESFQTLC